jgi:hypothetical protein
LGKGGRVAGRLFFGFGRQLWGLVGEEWSKFLGKMAKNRAWVAGYQGPRHRYWLGTKFLGISTKLGTKLTKYLGVGT